MDIPRRDFCHCQSLTLILWAVRAIVMRGVTSDDPGTIGLPHFQVRSGVKKLRVIDFDQVTLSSLNRHAVATWEDVGRPKARYSFRNADFDHSGSAFLFYAVLFLFQSVRTLSCL